MSQNQRPLTAEEIRTFDKDGVLFVKNMFSNLEMDLLLQTAKTDKVMESKSYGRKDAEGGISKLSLWNHPPNNLYGMFARCNRLVEGTEALLKDEVYHYHSKLMLKEAFIGGKWQWHQDYGYWYNNGCLFPDMLSVMIAVDRTTKENGCLQVLKGSHKMGRVHHQTTGEQAGADMERVNEAIKHFELVYCEMEPGDALFMHSNILHTSAANKSPNPRWTLICCYNTKHNDPYKDSHHPRYTPLQKVADSAILEMGPRGFSADDKYFIDPKKDVSATSETLSKN